MKKQKNGKTKKWKNKKMEKQKNRKETKAMNISIRERDGITILQLSGELNYDSYKILDESIIELLNTKKCHILLDFTGITHIDSMGVGTVTSLWKLAKEKGGELILTNLKPNLEKMIKLVNIDKRIKVFSSTAEALAGFEHKKIN